MSAEDDLVQELVAVRRGWGLRDRSLGRRTGPHLRRACGIRESADDREVHDRVRSWLTAFADELPPELARAVVVAFALDRDRQYRQLTQRVAYLAAEQSCAPRTARRRVDHATRLLARAALRERPADGPDPFAGWRLRSVRTVLRLDTALPELHETCVVVGSGGRGSARLPVLHESRVAEVAAPDRVTRPHYTLLPSVPCDHFDLEIRFRPGHRPAVVWRLDAVPPWSLDADLPREHPLEPDGAGEVRIVFGGLKQRHAYGLTWD
ncbi:hypothetical protein [Dactylosporangium sp. NPDC005555]|uniref:hypothetical protein n=1 Tax=Dactylosporangium sp. NPDC005555 TaxID=3154889 RepID=UPI0033BC3066